MAVARQSEEQVAPRTRFDSREHFRSRARIPSFEARMFPRLAKERAYLRTVQLGQFFHGDMTHPFAGSLQDSCRILQIGAARKPEGDVSGEDADVAEAVGDDACRRAIQQNDLRAHREDVFMTRRHFLVDDLSQTEGKCLDRAIVLVEKVEQFRWMLHRGASTVRSAQL